MAVNNDNEDKKTVTEILQEVEGPAREERKRYSNAVSILVAILLVAAAIIWLLS